MEAVVTGMERLIWAILHKFGNSVLVISLSVSSFNCELLLSLGFFTSSWWYVFHSVMHVWGNNSFLGYLFTIQQACLFHNVLEVYELLVHHTEVGQVCLYFWHLSRIKNAHSWHNITWGGKMTIILFQETKEWLSCLFLKQGDVGHHNTASCCFL